ncbi:MAG: Tm-1-like ATP-binding domain-containing protein [Deltaproteobacteria bacterium]|nr:Tm-1-like ATP-binding domain-containing protein [Deltaproteobacteria bacterium]
MTQWFAQGLIRAIISAGGGTGTHISTQIMRTLPMGGWSEADREGGPLYDPQSARVFLERLERDLDPRIEVRKVEYHINEQDFAREAARLMDQMLRET